MNCALFLYLTAYRLISHYQLKLQFFYCSLFKSYTCLHCFRSHPIGGSFRRVRVAILIIGAFSWTTQFS